MVHIVDENSLDVFREKNKSPSWVDLEIPRGPIDVYSLSKGHWIPTLFIAKYGVNFPPNPPFLEFCQYFNMVPARVAPNTWRDVNWFHELNELYGPHIGVLKLMFCYKWVTVSKSTYYLKTRQANRALVINLPDSNKDYWEYALIVKNCQYAPFSTVVAYTGPRCPQSGGAICYHFINCLSYFVSLI